MTNSVQTKVLILEGNALLRGELAGRLGAKGCSVVVADHGAVLGRLVEAFRPDIAVIEVSGDRPDEYVATVKSLGTFRLIASISSSVPPDRRVRAIRAGADDVVIRPFDSDELLMRIENLRQRFGADALVSFEDIVVDESAHLVYRGDAELDLTVTEFNLLATFVRNAGRVMSKRQLLASVWGFDDYDVNLVEVHVSALRRKLEQHGPRVVQTVRGIGYVLRSLNHESQHVMVPDLVSR